ncbi:SPFH domain-containing protein [Stigmatella aurantiaca]|uniref:Band 7 family protein n=1 Tax=Stigmatella aurantiaca (strain DW4/3-1) TaxID=378806 RepID=Q090V7_STIAD|nr:SPFH domain-containing protein [Stigmatella aurantiaca]ADO75691.1 Band 7 family protein [Stigmatella aurantiaca DW4/3-1]EAU66242.1 spfh domain / band 7 family protein [Stigmatella aurantiaca DW4/3-1]
MKVQEKLKEVLSVGGAAVQAAVVSLVAAAVASMRWLLLTRQGRWLTAGLVVASAVVALGTTLISHPPVQVIEPAQVGIRVNLLTGTSSEVREGWVLMLPHVHRLYLYSLKDQVYRTERSLRADGPAPFQAAEGLSIGIEVTLRYALDPVRIPDLAQRLPGDVGREIVEPSVDGVLRRHFAQHTVREIFATHRAQIQKDIAAEITPLLREDGIVLRSVTLGNVDLPHQYRAGVEALLAEELSAEKMRYTLELKSKQVQESELNAEAEKVRREKNAEAAGNEEIIAAKAKAEAMRHVLPFKEKEIEQRRLEAEASKVSRLTQASAEADARRIEAQGEADARRKLAESEAYRVEVTGKAASEQLARDADLISRNPLLIQKTLADKLSDKIQVIIAPPQAGGFIAGGLLGQPQDAQYANRAPPGAAYSRATAPSGEMSEDGEE